MKTMRLAFILLLSISMLACKDDNDNPLGLPNDFKGKIVMDINDGADLIVIDKSGIRKIEILGQAYQRRPSWSPDGTKIAMIDREDQLFIIDEAGDEMQTVLVDTFDKFSGPSYSPDGIQLAYIDGKGRLNTINTNGSNKSRISELELRYPLWSPNSDRIMVGHLSYPSDIFLISADGSEVSNLTNTPDSAEVAIDWSGDGTEVVFRRSGKFHILHLASGQSRSLPNVPSLLVSGACWAPDGSYFISSDWYGLGGYQPYITNSDGSYMEPFTHYAGSNNPDWHQ